MQESVLESVTCHCLPVGDISRSSRPHTTHQMPLVFIFQNKLKLGMSKTLLSVGILQVFFIFNIKKSFMMFTELPSTVGWFFGEFPR